MMGRMIMLFFALSLLSFKCFSQSDLAIEYIDDYPIKIDGGCNFFAFERDSLKNDRFIYIVSGNKTGFFKLNGKFVFVEHQARIRKTDGYTDRFAGDGYHIELDVARHRKLDFGRAEVSGILKIAKGAQRMSIRVRGINEDGSL